VEIVRPIRAGYLCPLQVLVVLEGKVQRGTYQASHINTILGFETESVPVQQFQGRVAAAVIGHAAKGDLREFAGMAPVVNLALRVGSPPPFPLPICSSSAVSLNRREGLQGR